LRVRVCEKDSGIHNDDDILGDLWLHRKDEIEGSKWVYQTTGDKNARYEIWWRVIEKPIPTLRVLGVMCHKQTAGCDPKVVEAACTITSEIVGRVGNVIGKSPRPRAKVIAKGFNIVSNIIGESAPLIEWICHAAEGADDVYIQRIMKGDDGAGGGFFPTEGRNCPMLKGDTVNFDESPWMACNPPPPYHETPWEAHYYRFPLDRGPVTIQLRERDKVTVDVPMGHITIDEAKYNQLKDKGADILLCDEYFRSQRQEGQGALYSLCFSAGLEDWALPATAAGQGE
jgi:hypothetical protein